MEGVELVPGGQLRQAGGIQCGLQRFHVFQADQHRAPVHTVARGGVNFGNLAAHGKREGGKFRRDNPPLCHHPGAFRHHRQRGGLAGTAQAADGSTAGQGEGKKEKNQDGDEQGSFHFLRS